MGDRQAANWLPVVGTLLVADITAAFETMMIYAALKQLNAVFGGPAGVAWLVTAYLLVSAAASAVCGRLGDLYGRKRIICLLLAVAVVGSVVSATGGTLGWMILGRALQGASGAIIPLSYGVVREHVALERAPFAGGLIMSGGALGNVAGLVLGGLIVDHGAWTTLFWLSAALAAVSLLMALLLLPADTVNSGVKPRLDVIGGLLFVPATTMLLLAISNAHAWGWYDPRFLALLLGAVALGLAWVRHERRHPDPLIDVRLLAQRDIALPNLCMVLVSLGGLQLTMVQMLFLQQPLVTGIGLGLTATFAGALKVPANLCSTLMAPLAGHISRAGRTLWVTAGGFALNILAWLLMLALHQQLAAVVVIIILSTVGTTAVFVGVANDLTLRAPPSRTSEALGMSTLARSIATAIGAQLITVILASRTISDPAKATSVLPAPSAYLLTFGLIVALSVLGLGAALLFPSNKPAAIA